MDCWQKNSRGVYFLEKSFFFQKFFVVFWVLFVEFGKINDVMGKINENEKVPTEK